MQHRTCHASPRFTKAVLTAARGAALFGVASALVLACARPVSNVETARALMARGELSRACSMARHLVDEDSARAEQLERLRCWIDCLSRRGSLNQAREWLARRHAGDALALYGRGLVAIASSPEAVTEALGLLEQAAQHWPDQGEIRYRAGLILLANGQSAAAERQFMRSCPSWKVARCVVAWSHALADLGREAQALDVVRAAPDLHPRPEDIARGRALIKRFAQRHAEQIPATQSMAYRQAASEVSAIVRLQRLQSVSLAYPTLAEVRTALGLVSLELDRPRDAIAELEQAARLAPLDPRNPFYLAVAQRALGRPDRAESAYREALRLDPFLVPAAAELVKLLTERGARQEAAQAAERLAAIDLSPNGRRSAARANYTAGQLGRALEHYRWLAAHEPANFEAPLRLAEILFRQRNQLGGWSSWREQQARAYLDRAAHLRPDSPEVQRLKATFSGLQSEIHQ